MLVHHSGSLCEVFFLILAHADVKHVAKGALARAYLSGVTTHDLLPQLNSLFVSKAGELVYLLNFAIYHPVANHVSNCPRLHPLESLFL